MQNADSYGGGWGEYAGRRMHPCYRHGKTFCDKYKLVASKIDIIKVFHSVDFRGCALPFRSSVGRRSVFRTSRMFWMNWQWEAMCERIDHPCTHFWASVQLALYASHWIHAWVCVRVCENMRHSIGFHLYSPYRRIPSIHLTYTCYIQQILRTYVVYRYTCYPCISVAATKLYRVNKYTATFVCFVRLFRLVWPCATVFAGEKRANR